jgi:hypothetical protein
MILLLGAWADLGHQRRLALITAYNSSTNVLRMSGKLLDKRLDSSEIEPQIIIVENSTRVPTAAAGAEFAFCANQAASCCQVGQPPNKANGGEVHLRPVPSR